MLRYVVTFFILFFSGLGLFLSGAHVAVFDPKGAIALAEQNLITTTVILMLIVVIPVFVLLFTFAWRYRATNTKAKYAPDWQNNVTLEVVWWAIPSVIILVLGVITWKSTHALDPYRPIESGTKPLVIQVVALDWKWLFIYPEQNIATVNYIKFPVHRPVQFVITADAPMNSFWIPQLGGQIYAMPGMKTTLHLIADETGQYRGASSNFSGAGFAGMKFVAEASAQQDFDAWVASIQHGPNTLSQSGYAVLAKPSQDNPVTVYAAVEKGLYNDVMMKYMMPASTTADMPTDMEGMEYH